MPAWTLDEAKQHLKAWLDADIAVATSQEYRMDGRTLTRANAKEITDKVNFWRREVARLENGGSNMRILRAIPRDL
jgi:hypothetical protein